VEWLIGLVAAAAMLSSLPAGPRYRASSAGSTPIEPCGARDLRARGVPFQGMGAAALGGVIFINNSDHPCRLKGSPRISLHTPRSTALPVESRGWPWALRVPIVRVSRYDLERGILRPHHKAFLWMSWADWCGGRLQGPLSLVITLSNGGALHVGFLRLGPRPYDGRLPPCGHDGRPSVLYVGNIFPISEAGLRSIGLT
jgi:hypothetical protein